MVGWFDMVHPIGKFDIADSAVSAVGPVMRSSLIVADGDALQRIAVAAERIAAHLTEMRTTPCCAAGDASPLTPGEQLCAVREEQNDAAHPSNVTHSPEDAATQLRLHPQTVRKLLRSGTLGGFKDRSRRWWVRQSDIDDFLRARRRIHGD